MALVFVVSLLAILLALYWVKQVSNAPKVVLVVNVVYLLRNKPIDNVVVEVVSTNNRVVARGAVDSQGRVVFNIHPGQYSIRTAAGYAGELSVNLLADTAVDLEVLPILR